MPESDIAIQYALESAGPDQGISLIPSDPVQAALMRVKIGEFNKRLTSFFGLYMTRFKDMQKIDDFVAQTIPWYEQMI